METLTIKLDAAEVLEAIGKMLEPGSVLLSAEAVRKLCEDFGVSAKYLANIGAVYSTENVETLAKISEQG